MDSSTPSPETKDPATEAANLQKIQSLLKAKDDTQRFVGLALLKSVLDNSPHLRQDATIVQGFWDSLSPKFLDRLLRTGSKPSSRNQNAKEMLDLVVSVLHTFAILLVDRAGIDPKFVDRIPGLVGAVLFSSEETTKLILQLLHTLVSSENGAKALVKVEDLSSLTEIAPTHSAVLDIFSFAWLNAMTVTEDVSSLMTQVDSTIEGLVSSFTGTDGVTLLEFLGYFLRHADTRIIPTRPTWLKTAIKYIHTLVTSRPTSEARSAYTNAAASLLQAYPTTVPNLLFTAQKKDDKPFSYLLINLLLIDIRSSAPTLLEQLNKPEYPKTSQRLASAFDVISSFIGYLIQSLEDESSEFPMLPESLLKLRTSISDTMSVTIEYLRDRWDAAVAGAMGLHPDARIGAAETATGSHRTLAWDSMKDNAEEDMFILSAIRALALWLREEDNDTLRKETTGLMDMFMDLYKSSSQDKLDFRSPVLVALQGITSIPKGRVSFLDNNGWSILTSDLLSILPTASPTSASRGTDIVGILLPLVEEESGGIPEAWMDLITGIAAWNIPEPGDPTVLEFQAAVLQLCCVVLTRAGAGMRRRYMHSISAIRGIAVRLKERIGTDNDLKESITEILDDLGSLENSYGIP